MVRESLTEKVIFKKRPEGKQSPDNGVSGQEVASAKILGQAGAKVLEEQEGGQGPASPPQESSEHGGRSICQDSAV